MLGTVWAPRPNDVCQCHSGEDGACEDLYSYQKWAWRQQAKKGKRKKNSTWYILIVPDTRSLSLREAVDAGLHTWHVFNPFMILGVLTSYHILTESQSLDQSKSFSQSLCTPFVCSDWVGSLCTVDCKYNQLSSFLEFYGACALGGRHTVSMRSFWGYAGWKIASGEARSGGSFSLSLYSPFIGPQK